MTLSLKTCLAVCSGSLVTGFWFLVFAESAAQKGFSMGTMIASLGIGIVLLLIAELE